MNNVWPSIKLSELSKNKDAVVSGPFGSNLKVSDYKDGGVPILRLQNIGKGYFIDKNIKYISEKKAEELKYHSFISGDIALAKLGIPIGKTCIIPNNFISGIITADVVRIRPNSKIVDYKYLEYFLNTDLSVVQLTENISGATRPRVNLSDVRNIKVPLPSLAEQKRVVKKLNEFFESIDRVKINAEKNLQNSKDIFESYSENIFSNPKKNWKKKELGDVCSLYQGIAINAKTKNSLVEKSELPLLRIKDLKNNTIEKYIDPNNYPKNALVNESDIIYTRTGSLGLVFRGKKGVLHNNSFKVIPNSELSNDYLFIWLQNPIFKQKILSLAGRAAQPDITHAIFKIQNIYIPSIKDQKTIVRKLNGLLSETKRLESIYQQKLTNLEEFKKSILSKVFNGDL